MIGDNIIYPGAPDYLQYFKESKDYESVLYHSNIDHSDKADAVLVSQRVKWFIQHKLKKLLIQQLVQKRDFCLVSYWSKKKSQKPIDY